MDVIKEKKRTIDPKSKILWVVVALLVFSGYQFMRPSSSEKVVADELMYGTVQQGDMKVEVEGYGVLRSDRQKLLTAFSGATIEEILLKPGATVTSETVIMRLSNPELEREVQRAEQNLSQQKADLRRLKLSHKRDVLLERAQLAELEANYKVAKFRYSNEKKLKDSGTVSELDFITSMHRHEQLETNLMIRQDLQVQLDLINSEMIKIQQQQINQAESLYQTALNRVERLTLRAGMNGVLQDMPVELGQSVIAGQALALIGSTDDLVALIRVPQTQAERIKIGQATLLDLRTEKTQGKVTRIVPAVEEGTVTIEVAFAGNVPASARPELSVNGTIVTATLSDIWFMERPINALENGHLKLFKLSEDASEAQPVPVSFGVENGRFIQITAGVQAGDRFILSDMRKFVGLDNVSIVN